MSECPSIAACPFYNDKRANKPALVEMYKNRFCRNNNSACARWKVASTLGKQAVPSDLFPNQNERADNILNKKG